MNSNVDTRSEFDSSVVSMVLIVFALAMSLLVWSVSREPSTRYLQDMSRSERIDWLEGLRERANAHNARSTTGSASLYHFRPDYESMSDGQILEMCEDQFD